VTDFVGFGDGGVELCVELEEQALKSNAAPATNAPTVAGSLNITARPPYFDLS
jgi:hypothetical protein